MVLYILHVDLYLMAVLGGRCWIPTGADMAVQPVRPSRNSLAGP